MAAKRKSDSKDSASKRTMNSSQGQEQKPAREAQQAGERQTGQYTQHGTPPLQKK